MELGAMLDSKESSPDSVSHCCGVKWWVDNVVGHDVVPPRDQGEDATFISDFKSRTILRTPP